jgi:hypothetical protein
MDAIFAPQIRLESLLSAVSGYSPTRQRGHRACEDVKDLLFSDPSI